MKQFMKMAMSFIAVVTLAILVFIPNEAFAKGRPSNSRPAVMTSMQRQIANHSMAKTIQANKKWQREYGSPAKQVARYNHMYSNPHHYYHNTYHYGYPYSNYRYYGGYGYYPRVITSGVTVKYVTPQVITIPKGSRTIVTSAPVVVKVTNTSW